MWYPVALSSSLTFEKKESAHDNFIKSIGLDFEPVKIISAVAVTDLPILQMQIKKYLILMTPVTSVIPSAWNKRWLLSAAFLVILLIFISAVSSYIYFCPPPAIEYFILFQFELFKLHRTLTYFALNFYSLSFIYYHFCLLELLICRS